MYVRVKLGTSKVWYIILVRSMVLLII